MSVDFLYGLSQMALAQHENCASLVRLFYDGFCDFEMFFTGLHTARDEF
jgi:hypothetical protein